MQIFFSVGEPSGDLHGSNLIRELREQQDNIDAVGFGGPKMAASGCQLDADLTELAIMGFARVVPHLAKFRQLYSQADRIFRERRPDAVVLIDYPGFNWWVARKAKQHGIPVFYYGTPQIWAWATHRVKKLRRLVDHSLCKLPFEPDWYRERDCQATYVGHPYFDDFLRRPLDQTFIRTLGTQPLVALLPGSRRHEVELNLPAFLKTIDFVRQSVPEATFAVASYNAEQEELAHRIIDTHAPGLKPDVFVERTRELVHVANCCLACSGSVSLELLHEAKPTVIHYKISRYMDVLQRRFRCCKYITLVNLLASDYRFDSKEDYDPDDTEYLAEAPFPEYLTVGDRSAEMAHHLVRWLTNDALRQRVVDRLEPLRASFVKPGASRLAANYILKHMADAETNADLPFAAKVA